MLDRLKLGVIATAMGLLLIAPMVSQSHTAEAQAVGGRFRVLVPNFAPMDDARDNFGKDVAKELRKMINDLATHQPVDEKELKNAMKQYDIDEDDLNCIRARQLANLINAEVVVCGSYSPEGGQEKVFRVNTQFVTVSTGEAFDVPSFVGTEEGDGKKEAAAQIAGAFERLAQQGRAMQFCADYAQSQQWDNAMENCDQAIALNPASSSARMVRARILRETERMPESLTEYEEVLRLDPMNETALQAAGYVSAQLGEDDKARRYYSDYLELDPMNSAVRMRVAYDLAQAGDPSGAMGLLQGGLQSGPELSDRHRRLPARLRGQGFGHEPVPAPEHRGHVRPVGRVGRGDPFRR